MTKQPRPVVLFDVDGTILDSAPGIIASLQAAMADVGVEPADDEQLRSDLGPPPAIMFGQVGVPEKLINEAVRSYRRHYARSGMQNARVYDGVTDALTTLQREYRLATATMKLIETATVFLDHHGIRDHFEMVGGACDGVFDKSAIIAATRTALDGADAADMIMIGDRHSDITGGRVNGLRTIAVTWGYGSRAELEASGPDLIIDRPEQLPEATAELLARAVA
ncbi:HAD hydrolase-like protein [Microlunatus sp. Gsoil 973]|uniref:HAD hydrolase-like protein n=1 Tax=Microlunatus sp. Gsoil 973 TaxID=2672569 RepID=UPI0012B4C2E2|nr:HAD hydrolase-like protein [Microlunatus sp. Gsoil 973]QGN32197.1 HAD hydrolase-like protein [Microlunatus sp. Gsoil 973]